MASDSEGFFECPKHSTSKVESIVRLLLFCTFMVFLIILFIKPEWGFPLYQLFGIDSNNWVGYFLSILILGSVMFSMIGRTALPIVKDIATTIFKGTTKTVKCGIENLSGTIESAIKSDNQP